MPTTTTTPGAPECAAARGGGFSRVELTLGLLLLGHFVFLCGHKAATDCAHEIAWMSHIGLLLAAVGFLLRVRLLLATALINILVLHGLWLVDCLTWGLTGHFPLGITSYLRTADGWTWLATAHHFYLAPLLLVAVYRTRERRVDALLLAAIVYLALTAFSRAALPAAANINYAFGVETALDVPFFDWANRQPGGLYLPGLNMFVILVMFTPAYLLIRNWHSQHRTPGP